VATYPTGIYAPASKSNGQTIQASFFNDPEAEITAIEDALKNGIAHAVTVNGALTVSTGGVTVSTGSVNIAGPSSLATLQVNGGSTLTALRVTSTVTFDSSVTFSGNVNVSGVLTVGTLALSVPSVRVSLSGDAATSSATEMSPTWDVQDWSIGGMHSTTTNSSRLTFAHSTGLYAVGFSVALTNTGPNIGSARSVRIRYNDATPVCGNSAPGGSSEAVGALSCAGVVRVASTTDYITARYIEYGSQGTMLAASTRHATNFWAYKVS
jgi:hypothetical protein